jgi:hypothetical protein
VTKKELKFQAQVGTIKTLGKGGFLVALSLSDQHIKQIAQLLECKKSNAVLDVTAVTVQPAPKTEKRNGTRKRERYPYRTNS